MTGFLQATWIILCKDLKELWRGKNLFFSLLVFAALFQVILSLVLDARQRLFAEAGGGILWLPILFASLLSFQRHVSSESRDGGWLGLMTAPIDRGAIFLAKMSANLVLVLAIEAISVPLFFLFFAHPAPLQPGLLAATLLLGTWGFVSLGSFLSVMSSGSRLGELLLPLLLFPLSIPLLLGVVELTGRALYPTLPGGEGVWFAILVAYDVIFTLLPLLLYEFLLEV